MKRALVISLIGAMLLSAEPVRIIFDTDMGNDIDDALALAMLHALESRGEVKLLAVTLTKDNRYAPAFVDLVNTFYGRGAIPVGAVRDGKTPEDQPMIQAPCELRRDGGALLYPRRIKESRDAPEAVALIRRVLEAQPDHSVTFVQVGFSTNLARLIASRDGLALAKRKARVLVAMAGNFAGGQPEYNIRIDLPASQAVFRDWPTPIVASGFEIGQAMPYPARSIENDFNWTDHHPVVDAYRAYKKMPYDRPTWDLTAVLYAARPDRGYFTLSEPGEILVDAKGSTRFEPSPQGSRRYLKVNDIERARALEAMIELASQPARP